MVLSCHRSHLFFSSYLKPWQLGGTKYEPCQPEEVRTAPGNAPLLLIEIAFNKNENQALSIQYEHEVAA